MATGNHNEEEARSVGNNVGEEAGNLEFEDSLEDIDLEDLNENQLRIDSVLKFLLTYNPPKKAVGRPRKTNGNNANNVNSSGLNDESSFSSQCVVPEEWRDKISKINSMQDLNPGLLMDYLVRLNEFNKKVLQSVGVLHKKLNELKRKQSDTPSTANVPNVSTPLAGNGIVHPTENEGRIGRSDNVGDLETRVDAIEQKSNANIFLCSGSVIKDVIETVNNDPNNNNLKDKLTSAIENALPSTVQANDIIRVSPHGKQKTHVKVVCSSSEVRKRLIAAARRRKPENIYFSEFLTNYRNGLFYSLRSLRNRFREKISSVYIRDGNIFYKLNDTSGFKTVRTPRDITALKKKLTDTE